MSASSELVLAHTCSIFFQCSVLNRQVICRLLALCRLKSANNVSTHLSFFMAATNSSASTATSSAVLAFSKRARSVLSLMMLSFPAMLRSAGALSAAKPLAQT